jgi:hypothetical protein
MENLKSLTTYNKDMIPVKQTAETKTEYPIEERDLRIVVDELGILGFTVFESFSTDYCELRNDTSKIQLRRGTRLSPLILSYFGDPELLEEIKKKLRHYTPPSIFSS